MPPRQGHYTFMNWKLLTKEELKDTPGTILLIAVNKEATIPIKEEIIRAIRGLHKVKEIEPMNVNQDLLKLDSKFRKSLARCQHPGFRRNRTILVRDHWTNTANPFVRISVDFGNIQSFVGTTNGTVHTRIVVSSHAYGIQNMLLRNGELPTKGKVEITTRGNRRKNKRKRTMSREHQTRLI